MWQRWNQTTHIFEKSDNDGATWVPLPLNASILTEGTIPPAVLGGSLAYTNVANIFNQRQIVSSSAPRWELYNTDAAVNTRRWGWLAWSEGNLYLQTYDDTGVAILNPVWFNRSGNTHLGYALQTGGVIYPGRVDAPAGEQSGWYLASHSSYGLYSTTGLWLGGSFWVPNGNILLRNFTVGVWADYSVGVWAEVTIVNSGTESKYMLIANTMWIDFRGYITLNGNSTYFYINMPAVATRICSGHGYATGPGGITPIHCESGAGSSTISCKRASSHPYDIPYFQSGAWLFYLHICIQINN